MIEVELQNADGDHVARLRRDGEHGLPVEGPEIIVWRWHAYLRHRGRVYREATAWWAPQDADRRAET